MFYKVILECRSGNGSPVELTRYIEETGIADVLRKLSSMPRVGKKSLLGGIKLLKEITFDEYLSVTAAERPGKAPGITVYEHADPNDYRGIKK